jgi:hypothetical protein
MSSKKIVYFLLFIGSIVGAYIPKIWGAGFLSFSSVIFSSVGAIIGVILGIKLTK